MIDLSYLTQEEQEMIKSVLKRDSKLKKAEEERVKKLKRSGQTKSELKYKTGEWFYEAKSQRHRDKIHGSEVVNASLKQKKPPTLLELSQIWAERPSFVNSTNRDIFIPAELSGLIEEPDAESREERELNYPDKVQPQRRKPSIEVSGKQRQNPFNSPHKEVDAMNGVDRKLINGDHTPDGVQHDYQANSHAPKVSSAQHSMDGKGDDDDDDETDPVTMALKRIAPRPMSSSKSLENVASLPTAPAAPAPPVACFSDLEKMKRLSMSVPAFVLEEFDGRGCESPSTFNGQSSRQKRTGISLANLSSSSGMTSMSSVSGSVMSIYSGDFGNVDVRGTIQFAINYVQKLGELHIFVVQCRDLAVADTKKNRSDPYVKCYLLPDKAKLGKRKTSVKRKTLNPTYNEILRYRVGVEVLKSQTLNVSVWHNDPFGRNSFLGEVDMDLANWDSSQSKMNDLNLKPKASSGLQPTDYRGEMKLALRFLPQIKKASKTGEVQIWVKECKNLPVIRGAAIDPFVKCAVLPDNHKKSRQKTRVMKKTRNPEFNHTLVYEGFNLENLKESCVELTVWDHDRLSNHFLGGLRLGLGTGKSYGGVVNWMDSNSHEASLWERMMASPSEWVEDMLPLRMLIMARSMTK